MGEVIPGFEFDSTYLAFLRWFHGATPVSAHIKLEKGHPRFGDVFFVERFLNYAEMSQLSDADRLFNAHVVISQIEDRSGEYLLPFATANADLFCFDYAAGRNPSVVLWLAELSEEDEPYTIPVASSFATFLAALQWKRVHDGA
ncbi:MULTISPECIES: SMI1/KNR4 family protein [unclassified Pseudoxanthomonas]|uniref:SMI1/KNR4 family protein n=1 Tax=unclassified Pseudoxanthomonas TaxID=2645906 RepID=UPI00307DA102